ncbi:MAG TPA: hypothetical protein VFK40_10960 [Nitrososphaeraceae archaeon]|nr:hypothetical protein [Nitrososphaeraceae archaeon]
MANADNFGIEERKAEEAIVWMNSYAIDNKKQFQAKLEGYLLITKNFGNFEIISWKGDWSLARNLIIKVSRKLSAKVIESGYHQKDLFLLSLIGANKEIAKVYKKGNIVGNLILTKKSGQWIVKKEKLI